MSNGYPDRSKQRSNDGLIGMTARTVQNLSSNTREMLDSVQTGTQGKLSWGTNLLEMLGHNLYGGISGKQSMAGVGKRALEQSLFGMNFDIGTDKSIGFQTSPGEMGRDYKLTFTKKFN